MKKKKDMGNGKLTKKQHKRKKGRKSVEENNILSVWDGYVAHLKKKKEPGRSKAKEEGSNRLAEPLQHLIRHLNNLNNRTSKQHEVAVNTRKNADVPDEYPAVSKDQPST